jgi:hypothetical protein
MSPRILFLLAFALALAACEPQAQRDAQRIKKNMEAIQAAVDIWVGGLDPGDRVKSHLVYGHANKNFKPDGKTTPDEKAFDFGNGEIIPIPAVGQKLKVPFAIFKRYEKEAPASFWLPFQIEPDLQAPLTREVAAQLLNEHLSQPHIRHLAFNKDGLQQAERDGIVAQAGGFPPTYRFSDKGLSMARGVANANTRIELAPLGMEDPKFPLASPIAESVTDVSGIALAPVPNICEVEYGTEYLVPNEFKPLLKYLWSGQRAKATFRKYDDGWRVAR